ncbi:hypothetical protein [Saccharopolyspora sp. 5N708]|uniref:hypothetical protein n=1 Tax=Saccharopolyspora sp. 5N708 TaxID=3457424 RepID=UPI003FD34B44
MRKTVSVGLTVGLLVGLSPVASAAATEPASTQSSPYAGQDLRKAGAEHGTPTVPALVNPDESGVVLSPLGTYMPMWSPFGPYMPM